ncbi:unnamed protein product [Triticum turgidum subsp. durum]|uniref:MATH domain-containing protein n=1 Tax=Triticum turgidum subsp. durum TaxID=4567 RepID=A0A9R1C4L9_TRITD|nr:unnamed protein product [Triticum turgidum subsp. durum]
MSISAAAFSALRGAGRQQLSASSIAARQATGSHMFQIDGQLRKMAANGAKVRSGTFRVGGHEWRLVCYPNGNGKEYEGYMSLFLEHASHERTGDATAKAQLSILDQAWKPSYTRDIAKSRFFSGNLSWGTRGFLKHQDLDALARKHLNLKDDGLTILCDVTVTVTELRTEDHVEAAAPVALPFGLPGQLGEAVWNTKGVDVHIEVGGETLPAHRGILEAGSPRLTTARRGHGRGGFQGPAPVHLHGLTSRDPVGVDGGEAARRGGQVQAGRVEARLRGRIVLAHRHELRGCQSSVGGEA